MTDDQGRSPNTPKQLHRLDLVPTATDPRPTFFWSADAPRDRDTTKTTLYPRLMWDAVTGEERTVHDAQGQATYTAKGWLLTPPANAQAPDPVEALRAQLEALSPQDRETLIKAQQTDRIATLQAKLAALDEGSLAALLASLTPAETRKRA